MRDHISLRWHASFHSIPNTVFCGVAPPLPDVLRSSFEVFSPSVFALLTLDPGWQHFQTSQTHKARSFRDVFKDNEELSFLNVSPDIAAHFNVTDKIMSSLFIKPHQRYSITRRLVMALFQVWHGMKKGSDLNSSQADWQMHLLRHHPSCTEWRPPAGYPLYLTDRDQRVISIFHMLLHLTSSFASFTITTASQLNTGLQVKACGRDLSFQLQTWNKWAPVRRLTNPSSETSANKTNSLPPQPCSSNLVS